MRAASKSPLRASVTHRGDDAAFLRQENERLKSELSVLKDMCTTERLKSQELSEKLDHASGFKFSVESSLHGELKRQAEVISRLRDELRKKDIANAELAVKLSEQEQTSAKFLEEYRMLGDTLSAKNDRLLRAEKESKLLGRQQEERQRLLEALSVEKAGMLREAENLRNTCKTLKDERDALHRQLQDKTTQFSAAMQKFGEDRELLIWESASRTRVLAAARMHFCLLQLFRVKKKAGYEAVRESAKRFRRVVGAAALLGRTVRRLRLERAKRALQVLTTRRASVGESTAAWVQRVFAHRLRKGVLSQWRLLATRRRKCRIVLKLFLQATHKAFVHSKKGLLRAGWKHIALCARSAEGVTVALHRLAARLRTLGQRRYLQRLREFTCAHRLNEALCTRHTLSRAFCGLLLNVRLEQHRDSLAQLCEGRKVAASQLHRQGTILQVLLAAKDLQRCLGALQSRHLASAWSNIRAAAQQRRERLKRAVTAHNVVVRLRDERLLFTLGKCFLAWKDTRLQRQLDSLAQEVETEKPLRQYYQTTSQEFGADLLRSKRVQAMSTLLTVLSVKTQTLQSAALQQLKRHTLLPRKALRKATLIFRGSLERSFSAWRRKVYELNLAGLCEDQAKVRVFNENLLEHVAELEGVLTAQAEERTLIGQRRLASVCERQHKGTKRNWLQLWRWVARRNTNWRQALGVVARVLRQSLLQRCVARLQANRWKSSERQLQLEAHRRKQRAKSEQAKSQIFVRWRYLAKLKKILVKVVVKFSGRRAVQTKSLAWRAWHCVVADLRQVEKQRETQAVHGEFESLRSELETLQTALATAHDVSQLYESTILKLAQKRLLVSAGVSVRVTLSHALRSWNCAVKQATARERSAKKLLCLHRRVSLQCEWRLWAWRCHHTEKQLCASQVREACADQEAARQLLSKVELQRDSDVTSLRRCVQEAESASARRKQQVVALLERVQDKRQTHFYVQRVQFVFAAWKHRVAHYRFAASTLFRMAKLHVESRGLARLKAGAQFRRHRRSRATLLQRLSATQSRRALTGAFFQWLKCVAHLKSSMLHKKLHSGETHLSTLLSNLSSVKKKLQRKTLVSAQEKRRWTVFHAWQRVSLGAARIEAAHEAFSAARRFRKLKLAIQKLGATCSKRSKLRRLVTDCAVERQRNAKARALGLMRRTVQHRVRVEKGARSLEAKLRKKLCAFSFAKLLRTSCVLRVHQRWKLKSGLSSLKRWLRRMPALALAPSFHRWRHTATRSSRVATALRRVAVAAHRRNLRSSLRSWLSRAQKAQSADFSSSQSALYSEMLAAKSRAQALSDLLCKEGLAVSQVDRLVKSGEKLASVTASTLRHAAMHTLPQPVLKETKRKFKAAAAKTIGWLKNWGVCHAFATWKRSARWLSGVPKKELIQAIRVLTPPVGDLRSHFLQRQKRFQTTQRRGKVVAAIVLKLVLSGKLHAVWAAARRFALLERLAELGRHLEDKSDDVSALRQSKAVLEREKSDLLVAMQQREAEGVRSEAVSRVLHELTCEREKLAEELAHRSFTIRKLLEENAGLSVKLTNAQMEAEKLILLSQESFLPAERETFSSPLRFDDLKSNG